MMLPQGSRRILGHCRGWRHVGERTAVGTAKGERVVVPVGHLKALFVDGSMVATAKQDEIAERGGTTLGPVANVVPLPDAHAAAREPACRSRCSKARRSAGGIVRVRAPTSSSRPSESWRITTRLASHARR